MFNSETLRRKIENQIQKQYH